jgi:hypothetical protein
VFNFTIAITLQQLILRPQRIKSLKIIKSIGKANGHFK